MTSLPGDDRPGSEAHSPLFHKTFFRPTLFPMPKTGKSARPRFLPGIVARFICSAKGFFP
jgi:hypothetical protein